MKLTTRLRKATLSRELKLFIGVTFMMGIASNIVDATFNNYLDFRFSLNGFQRSFLEFPRELPGFLVAFVSALLWFLCSRRLGAVSLFVSGAGILLVGFASPTYGAMVLCLFIYSLGQHLFLPLSSSIGMELAREGKTGKRLGQLNAVRNAAAIIGSFVVFLSFKFLKLSFQHTFVLSTLLFLVAAFLMLSMKPKKNHTSMIYLKLHKEYRLYYLLAILFGSRKQVFLTFAPWVLVTVFRQPTQTLATLLTVGGVIGILFQPLLGLTIDRKGERFVLIVEACLLVVVCLGYGFSRNLFSASSAFYITCICFLLDQMLMSVNMARSTYIKKIAINPDHVQPALTIAVTIDHVFSIAVALLGGLIWNKFGYQYVFLLGSGLAVINLFAAMFIRVPVYRN
ncbi:MAG: MFS transporter [Chitinivibrionales bacterium]|nr:MFS transporter [Chitinivibrionales bacterium]